MSRTTIVGSRSSTHFPPRGATLVSTESTATSRTPDNITVVAGFEAMQDALDFRDNPDLKGAMQDAGVKGAPRVGLFEEVEAIQGTRCTPDAASVDGHMDGRGPLGGRVT
jgi:hypothetical protein